MTELNDAAVLDQVRDHWQKIAALIVWKLAPNGVTITAKDIADCQAEAKILLTHGHKDSFEFRMVSATDAERIIAHDDLTNRGCA